MARIRNLTERVERWFSRCITASGECWIWTGGSSRNGYGQTKFGGRNWMAHRIFYTYFVADVPDGLDLDHLCRTRSCVNPWHLEPVTRSENLLRSDSVGIYGRHRRACPQGHPYDETNTAHRNGRRHCKACDRARAARSRARKAA